MGYCRDAAGKSEIHKDTIKGRRGKKHVNNEIN